MLVPPRASTRFSTKPRGEDGYALLRISPGTSLDDEKTTAKNIVFALDISGSMQGEKIEQAREALQYCLRNLGSDDHFGLVTYEANVRAVTEGLVRAGARVAARVARTGLAVFCGS